MTDLENIKAKLANQDLGKTISELRILLSNTIYIDDIDLLAFQYNEIVKKERKGIISHSDFSVSSNTILNRVQHLINEIKRYQVSVNNISNNVLDSNDTSDQVDFAPYNGKDFPFGILIFGAVFFGIVSLFVFYMGEWSTYEEPKTITPNKTQLETEEPVKYESKENYLIRVSKELLNHRSKEVFELIETKQFDLATDLIDYSRSQTTKKKTLTHLDELYKTVVIARDYDYDKVFYGLRDSLILIEKDGEYGLLSITGKVLFEPMFEAIEGAYFYPLLVTEDNNKFGVIDENGIELFRPIFDDIEPDYFSPLIAIEYDEKYGFINKRGELIIDSVYDMIDYIDDEFYILAKLNGKYGYIDTLGVEVIPFKYDTLFYYENGIARGKLDNRIIYINRKGQEVKNPVFE